jgi:hypothetical protein
VVIFGSVRLLLKIKVTKQIFFFKKTKTGSNRPVRFGSVGFLDKNRFKPVWFGFSVWLCFFGLARLFSGFFPVWFVSVFSVSGL